MSSSHFFSYPAMKCVMEYLDVGRRIPLIALCPSLRTIEKRVPLHLREFKKDLNYLKEGIKLDNSLCYLEDVSFENALEGLVQDRQSSVYVHHFNYWSFSKKLKTGTSKIVPTVLTCLYLHLDRHPDVIFGANSTFFSTENLKWLRIEVITEFSDLIEHPVLRQLEHLEIDFCNDPSNRIEILAQIPVPHLSIYVYRPSTAASLLNCWIRQNVENRKLSFIDVRQPEKVICELPEGIDFMKGTFESQDCWVAAFNPTSEVVITSEPINDGFRGDQYAMNVRVMPRGTTEIEPYWEIPEWMFRHAHQPDREMRKVSLLAHLASTVIPFLAFKARKIINCGSKDRKKLSTNKMILTI